jgi:hypothetical protein
LLLAARWSLHQAALAMETMPIAMSGRGIMRER